MDTMRSAVKHKRRAEFLYKCNSMPDKIFELPHYALTRLSLAHSPQRGNDSITFFLSDIMNKRFGVGLRLSCRFIRNPALVLHLLE